MAYMGVIPDVLIVYSYILYSIKLKINMEKSLDELVYALSCECKEASYSNFIEHREFIKHMAKKLEALAGKIQMDHSIAMQESSYNGK